LDGRVCGPGWRRLIPVHPRRFKHRAASGQTTGRRSRGSCGCCAPESGGTRPRPPCSECPVPPAGGGWTSGAKPASGSSATSCCSKSCAPRASRTCPLACDGISCGSSIGAGAEAPRQGGDHHCRSDEVESEEGGGGGGVCPREKGREQRDRGQRPCRPHESLGGASAPT